MHNKSLINVTQVQLNDKSIDQQLRNDDIIMLTGKEPYTDFSIDTKYLTWYKHDFNFTPIIKAQDNYQFDAYFPNTAAPKEYILRNTINFDDIKDIMLLEDTIHNSRSRDGVSSFKIMVYYNLFNSFNVFI